MRGLWLAGALCLCSVAAQASDLAEALRVWKFTYQAELQAFRLPEMTAEERQAKAAQLDLAGGSAVIAVAELTVCQQAAADLAQIYRHFGGDDLEARKEAYEISRTACIDALEGDPKDYPITWI